MTNVQSIKNLFININFTYLLIVSFVSFLWFIFKENTAYQWPAMDMYTFFERYNDPLFLVNDFFTNAITKEPNPRWIFGLLIIWTANLFSLDWYTVIYYLKVLLVVFMPISFYLALFSILREYLQGKNLRIAQTVLMLGIIIVIYPPISGLFSIAWWPPFAIQAAAQYLSLTIGLFAIFFCQFKSKKVNVFGGLFFAVAIFLQPQLGLFCFTFYFLANLPFIFVHYKKFTSLFLLCIFLPCVVLITVFKPSISLSANDFIDVYAMQMHSPHYNLENFGSLTPFSWKYSLTLIITLLLIPIIFFLKTHSKCCFIVTLSFLIAYLISIMAQYIFINVFPIKSIASLGPIRFTTFGYWMVLFSWSLMLSSFDFLDKLSFKFDDNRILFLILCVCTITGFVLKDDPVKTSFEKNKDTFEFIKTTPSDSVFSSYFSNFKLDIPHIAHRAIFIGNGFPFNESFLSEFQDRYVLLYGSSEDQKNIKGSWKGEKEANYYRKLTPNDFVNISKYSKLDYVLIEVMYSSSFENFEPVFINDTLAIYEVSSFE